MNLETTVDSLLEILARSERLDYIGERVSQLTHALQAAHFARQAMASDEEVLAALFHDIGHFCGFGSIEEMDGFGVASHEELGARFLEEHGFSTSVGELIRGHVAAKRYLVARHASYAARLSEASRHTLEHQGGPMSEAEAAVFESAPRFKAILRVRHWDEQAKIPELAVPGLEAYRSMLLAHLGRQQTLSS